MADEDVRITFRVDPERKERLEDLIDVHNALVEPDEKMTKSDLLRDCVDETIAELEATLQEERDALEEFLEGNPNAERATATAN